MDPATEVERSLDAEPADTSPADTPPAGTPAAQPGSATPAGDAAASGTPVAEPRHAPRARRGALTALVVAAAVIGLGLAGFVQHVVATELHARFWQGWSVAAGRLDESSAAFARQVDRGGSDLLRAESLQAVFTPALIPDADAAAFGDDVDRLRDALASDPAGPVASDTGLIGTDRFAFPWERYAEIARLFELVPDRHAAADRADEAASELGDVRTAVHEASDGIFDTAFEQAEAQLAAYPAATNRARLDLQYRLDGDFLTSAPDGTAPVLTELAQMVEALRVSHEAEQARRADPSYGVRGEIEAFAASLSNGVALDFAWAYEVAGKPSDGWFAGTADFAMDGDEWSLITLSFSIADAWRDPDAEAVVVHEVGHTQVTRDACRAIFDGPEFAGTDHEMWATAWAIGMGYDRPGAGIQAYGRPTDAQIAAASACR
ncbi:hypothetical protein [Agromyces larvae]|uniref:Neutral zinc metallopeptidase n=1 Tax=Agromyces larvae TaxID=2929802 RepID=A0ABY4BZU9_9MICO|nr:hypothetical protein [Agromyces larvae]UOE44439.1 hypothetical protein MTO99_01195 [Agromyces larvae]